MMDLPDVNNSLVRWQILPMDFDFKVYYCNGAEDTIADLVSQIPTWASSTLIQTWESHSFWFLWR